MDTQQASTTLLEPLRTAASALRRVPGARAVTRATEGALDKIGAVSPQARDFASVSHAPRRLGAAAELVDERVMLLAEARRQQRVQRLTNRIARRPAKYFLGAAIEMNDAMVLVHRDHGVSGDRQDASEHRVGCVTFILEALPLGDERADRLLSSRREANGDYRDNERRETQPGLDIAGARDVANRKADRPQTQTESADGKPEAA